VTKSHADFAVIMNGPLDTGVSGGDVHAMRLCERLAADGHRVRLVTPAGMADRLSPEVRSLIAPVTTPFDGRLSSMPAYLLAVTWRAVATALRSPAAHLDIASTHFFFDVVPAALRRGRVAAYVYHLIAESGRGDDLRSRVSIALEALSLHVLRRTADIVFVDNPETREALLRRGFNARVLQMTRNAYDPVTEMPARTEPPRPALTFVGRLVEAKGLWDILAVARALRDHAIVADIHVLGDGPLASELAARVRDEGLDGVHLLGFVDEAEKWRRLRGSTLFLAPSREEGWGIAVGEALIAGTPALVYDLPAYAHFGNLPVRVPLGDVDAFVAAALTLIAHERSLRERARVQAGARDLPTWASVLDDEAKVLNALLASGGGSAAGYADEVRVARVS